MRRFRHLRRRLNRYYRWLQDNPTVILSYIIVAMVIVYAAGWVNVIAENAPPYVGAGNIFTKSTNFQTLIEAIFVSVALSFGAISTWMLYNYTVKGYIRGSPTAALGLPIAILFIAFLVLLIVSAT